jgi:uncharacterized protein
MMQFTDAVTITGTRETTDGYLVADARIARTGVQIYLGAEVGRPDQYAVRVYRPEEEVFSNDSLASYAHKPLTNDHPAQSVTADTWRTLAVGNLDGSVARDGEFVRVPLIIMDSTAINDVKGGKRELSAGYTCDLVFDSGTTPAGEEYDAMQKNIRVNHVAIVARGRAGSQARIGDGAVWGVTPIDDHVTEDTAPMATRTVLVDGLQVETTDAGAIAIEKLTRDLADAKTAGRAYSDTLAKEINDNTAAIAAKDAEIGALKVDLQKAKDALPTGAALDAMVADRVALVTTARAILPALKHDGVSDADIRKAVVIAKMGDAAITGVSDAEISGMFKALARTADPLKGVPVGITGTNDAQTVARSAYDQMVADIHAGKSSNAA